ncbi:hypothetical protein ACFC06_27925 [Nocardia sp. NPDC056064]|uniref:hypothetical protein n=1 Tax=Nocardia sp. NPDC056064 TaxID=3345701 RepID=UPI0035DACF08
MTDTDCLAAPSTYRATKALPVSGSIAMLVGLSPIVTVASTRYGPGPKSDPPTVAGSVVVGAGTVVVDGETGVATGADAAHPDTAIAAATAKVAPTKSLLFERMCRN